MEKTLKEEFKKRNSIQIEIPALIHARLNFEFNPAAPYGRNEELVLLVESKYFAMPETERGNIAGYPAPERRNNPIFFPFNRSFKNQKISISGITKIYPGPQPWIDSDMKILQDKPLEKIIGFNSVAQPGNFEVMKCIVTFY